MLTTRSELGDTDPAMQVAARLRRSGYPGLRRVICQFRAGRLLLRGTVGSFYLRQIAQELAVHTRGVHEVANELLVSDKGSGRSTAGGSVASGSVARVALNV